MLACCNVIFPTVRTALIQHHMCYEQPWQWGRTAIAQQTIRTLPLLFWSRRELHGVRYFQDGKLFFAWKVMLFVSHTGTPEEFEDDKTPWRHFTPQASFSLYAVGHLSNCLQPPYNFCCHQLWLNLCWYHANWPCLVFILPYGFASMMLHTGCQQAC